MSKSTKNEALNIKSDKNKEEEKIISQDNTLRSFEKLIPIIKEEKKEEKLKIKQNNLLQEIIIDRKIDENKKENKKTKEIIVDRKIDEINKENKKGKEIKEINIEKIDEIQKENKNDNVININKNDIKNNKEKKDNKEDNKKRVFSEKKTTLEKHEFIGINDNTDIMNNLIKKENQMIKTLNINKKTSEQKNIFVKKNKNVVPTRIKIESHEKQERQDNKESQALSLSNSSGAIINISNQNIHKKDDIDTEIIKSINYNSFHFNENDNNINNNINSIKAPEKEKESNFIPIFHKFQNKDLQSKMRHRNRNMISPTKSLSYYIKSEKPRAKEEFRIKINEEQKQVMDDIKSHFNLMKGRQEQKSGENLVDCNVINLQLNYNKKKRQKNASAKILKNNLSEIGMKLNPAFGRTNYNFFIRNKLGDSYDNLISGLNQKNNLKNGLNAAFVSSIKNKINFNDKGNFFS